MITYWDDARESIQAWMEELAQDNLSDSDKMLYNHSKGIAAGKMIAYRHILLVLIKKFPE